MLLRNAQLGRARPCTEPPCPDMDSRGIPTCVSECFSAATKSGGYAGRCDMLKRCDTTTCNPGDKALLEEHFDDKCSGIPFSFTTYDRRHMRDDRQAHEDSFPFVPACVFQCFSDDTDGGRYGSRCEARKRCDTTTCSSHDMARLKAYSDKGCM